VTIKQQNPHRSRRATQFEAALVAEEETRAWLRPSRARLRVGFCMAVK